MLFRHIDLDRAADFLEQAIVTTVQAGIVTYDLARQMEDIKPVASSVFGREVTKRIASFT
jgi:isocitrate dehydrogenase